MLRDEGADRRSRASARALAPGCAPGVLFDSGVPEVDGVVASPEPKKSRLSGFTIRDGQSCALIRRLARLVYPIACVFGGPTREIAAAIEVRKPAPACTRRRGKPVAGSSAGTRQSAVMTSDIHGAGYVRLLA